MKADLNEKVETLKRHAEAALEVGKGRLLNSSGSVLEVSAPIKRASLQNGESLVLHIGGVEVQATRAALLPFLEMDRS